ncbi:hypothetical protein DQ04_03141060 [Trypanosoma grayi]|uniref:hypothetical protein n=1 Tax=Trypanosoma grayi TaxID=71804 RepID=UPI0004F42F6F|nr:hypothetical protein DQ04_03141060 [Trypanosoma grayi]KEG10934.1 hypothetical protein DQ04_03141060 [Trypanosoma grayi]
MSASTAEVERPAPREGMPREVVAWLRSLHLPRAVRNPKRDLSNGFLVAFICSRYWSSVSMHSYEDKLSVANKRSNWDMLRKQFAINKCPVSDRMIEGLIACRDDYANSFLRQLYTHLTGRVVVEALPLPAEEVAPPQTFVPQPSVQSLPTISVEAVGSCSNNASPAAARVRELPACSIAALKVSERIPPVAVANNHVIRAIVSDDASVAASGNGENGTNESCEGRDGNENAKPPMGFSVSLRRADVRQTVVHETARDDKKKPLQQQQQQQQQQRQPQFGEAHLMPDDATAMDLIESIVRAQAAGQEWKCARDGPTAFTEYFLHEEAALSVLLQCRVWSALFTSVDELVERVFRQGGSLAKITALFLQSPPSPPKQQGQQERVPSSGGTASESWKERSQYEGHAMGKRYTFVASLLASISDSDAFLAVSVYSEDVLPYAKEAMRSLDCATADGYAALLCAAVPANRKLAARLLPNVLSAAYEAITQSSSVEAKRSFYLLLRAVLLRLARGVWRGSVSASSRRSVPEMATSSLGGHDPLAVSIFPIAGYNVVAALSHESPRVRLVGAHLAGALASSECPLSMLFGTVLPMLNACCANASPLFNCVCAAWLQTAMKRLRPHQSEKSLRTPVAAAAAAADRQASTEREEEEKEEAELRVRALPQLATMMRHLCGILLGPGALNVQSYIAEQLALCLDDIPTDDDDARQLFHPEEVAACVFCIFQAAPPELLTTFLSPPSSAEAESHQQTNRMARCVSTQVGSALLGPLRINGALRDCYPLALAEAIVAVSPPESNLSSPPVGERGGSGGGRASSVASVGGVQALTPRQVMARATALLRDRAVPEETARRIRWLYRIIVASRRGAEVAGRPASLTEAAVTQRWNAVMRQMYRDIAVLAAAAEMIFSQKGALADGASNAIAQMAGMAQQVVLWWYTELHKDDMSLPKSSDCALDSAERLAGAMRWYHNTFGDATTRGQSPPTQPPQQQQRHSLASKRSMHRGTS